jgi:hypothetical protein
MLFHKNHSIKWHNTGWPIHLSVINTVTVEIDPTITSATETREGSNPVVNTVALDPVVTTVTEESDPLQL